ncbi:AraC family transcriptional regulator [Lactobacillus sp. CBA3606]|uniref:helix-turn-helix domain-containing protein n=1 Tax=Lactobacillus sp. CBA3606 TaxID=2099789 RepID=UPI000CFA9CFE|nr:helix-turn-helix transcriptional regulator [Lactobacillus sp. CBA3606]AVK64291.1 AraC family transcriptional regulator [Lactobacillus sp. CBA3606]
MSQNYQSKEPIEIPGVYNHTGVKTVTPAPQQTTLLIIESLTASVCEIDQQVVPLNPQDIILVQQATQIKVSAQPGVVKCRTFTANVTFPNPLNMTVVGDNPLIHDLMNDTSTASQYVVFHQLENRLSHTYCDLLVQMDQQDADRYLDFERNQVFSLLLTELLRQHRETVSLVDSQFPVRAIRHAGRETQAGAIFTYLSRQIATVTLTQAATHFGYQANYFSRLCRTLFNESFSAVKNRIRMEMAGRMLSLTTKGITEISFELGYKNVTSFYQAFSQAQGMTPTKFRQTGREN